MKETVPCRRNLIRGKQARENIQFRDDPDGADSEYPDEQLENAVSNDEVTKRLQVSVGQEADGEAPDAESKHEYRERRGDSIIGISKDEPQLSCPDDLVYQSANSGKEEQQIDKEHRDGSPGWIQERRASPHSTSRQVGW